MKSQQRIEARVARFARELSALVAKGIQQQLREAFNAPPSAGRQRLEAEVLPEPGRRARRTAEQLIEIQERIIKLITKSPKLTSEEIQEQLGLQKSDIQRPLDLLRAEGEVRTIGERRAMRYFVGAGKAGVVRRLKTRG